MTQYMQLNADGTWSVIQQNADGTYTVLVQAVQPQDYTKYNLTRQTVTSYMQLKGYSQPEIDAELLKMFGTSSPTVVNYCDSTSTEYSAVMCFVFNHPFYVLGGMALTFLALFGKPKGLHFSR